LRYIFEAQLRLAYSIYNVRYYCVTRESKSCTLFSTVPDSVSESKGDVTSVSAAAQSYDGCDVNLSSNIQTTQQLQQPQHVVSSSEKRFTPRECIVDDWENSLIEEFNYLERYKRAMSLPLATRSYVEDRTPPTPRQAVPPPNTHDDVTSPERQVNNQRTATKAASFMLRSSHHNNTHVTRQNVARATSLFEDNQQQMHARPQPQLSHNRSTNDHCSSSGSNSKSQYRTTTLHEPLVESTSGGLSSVTSGTSSVIVKSASVNVSPHNHDDDDPIIDFTNVYLRSPINPQKRPAPLSPSGNQADKSEHCQTSAVTENNILSVDRLSSQALRLQKKPCVKSGDCDGSECCMCYDRQRDCVIYRCGHVCICYECGLEIREFHKPPLCPICRQPISDIIKIYKS